MSKPAVVITADLDTQQFTDVAMTTVTRDTLVFCQTVRSFDALENQITYFVQPSEAQKTFEGFFYFFFNQTERYRATS